MKWFVHCFSWYTTIPRFGTWAGLNVANEKSETQKHAIYRKWRKMMTLKHWKLVRCRESNQSQTKPGYLVAYAKQYTTKALYYRMVGIISYLVVRFYSYKNSLIVSQVSLIMWQLEKLYCWNELELNWTSTTLNS